MYEEEVGDEELEEIRQRRLIEVQRRIIEAQRQEQLRREIEARKQATLRAILTPEARNRLTNIKMVKPEFGEQLELQIIQLAQNRKIRIPVTDEAFKKMLASLQQERADFKIRRV